METKEINSLINNVISHDAFDQLKKSVASTLVENLKEFPFESDDDVRLAVIRIKDAFVSGLNFEVAKKMMEFMGIDNKTK